MFAVRAVALSAFLVLFPPWQEVSAFALLVAVDDTAGIGDRISAQQVSVDTIPGGAVGLIVEDVDASLVLNSPSIATVSVRASDASEMLVSRVSLEFTPDNWDEAQEGVLSGLAGDQVDGSKAVALSNDLSSSDTVNGELPVVPQLLVGSVSDDSALVLDPTSPTDATTPTVLAEGLSSMVEVMLATEPTATVNVAVSVSDASEMSVSTANLVFTPGDWNVAQPVVLSAIDDGIVENTEEIVVEYQLSSNDTVYDDKSITRRFSVADKVVTPSITLETAALASIQEGDSMRAVTLRLSHPADSPVTVDFWLEDNYAEVTLVGSEQNIRVTRSFGALGRTESIPIQETTFTVHLSFPDDEFWSGDQRSFRLGAAIKGGPGAYATVAAVPLGNEDVAYSSGLDFVTGYAYVTGTVFDDEDIIEASPEEIILRRDTSVTIDWSVPVRKLPAVALRDGTSTRAETNTIRAGFSIEVTTTANRVSIHLDTAAGINPIRDGDVMKAGNINNLNTLLVDIPPFVLSARELPLYPEPVDVLLMVALRGEPRLENLPPEQRLVTVSGWVSEPELQLVPKTLTSIVEGSNADVSFHLGEPPSGPVTVDVVAGGIDVNNPEIVFSTSNWNTPRAVRFSTSNDVVVEDDETIEITYSIRSSDTDYDGKSPTQSLQVNDDDVAGLLVDPQAFTDINEDGGTATVTLRLMTAAKNGVTLSFTSSNPAVATLTATSVTAMLTTLADRATVTLETVDDTITGNGPRSYSLNVSVVSGPGGYDGLTLSIPGMVVDDDDAFLAPDPSSPTVLAEGLSSMAGVMLGTAPTATVNVVVSSSDASELSVSTASLVFTPGNWNVAQPVALSAIDDGLVENTEEFFVIYQFTSDDNVFDGKTITQRFSIADKIVTPSITLETAALASIQEGDSMRAVTLRLSHPADSPVTVDFWLEDNYAEVTLVGSEQNIRVTRSFGALGRTESIPIRETTFTVHLSFPDDEFWSGDQRSFRLGAAIKGGPGAYATVAAVPLGNEDVAYSSGLDFVTGYAYVTGTVFDDEDIIEASPEEIILRRDTSVTIDWSVPVRKLPAVALRDGTSTRAETNAIRAGFSIEVETKDNRVSIHREGEINPIRDGSVMKVGDINNLNTFLDSFPQFVLSARELPLYPQPVDVLIMVAFRGEPRLANIPPEQRLATVSGWVTEPELQLVPSTLPSVVEGSHVDVSIHLGEPPSTAVTVDVVVAEEVSVDITEIVFSPNDWNTPKAVRFTPSIDGVVEDDETIEITYNIRSSDTDYDGKSSIQSVVVIDVNVAGLMLSPTSLPDVAEGGERQVMVMLGSVPTATVTVAVSVSDSTELSVSSASLEFTPGDWNRAQEVVLTGVEDSLVDGTQSARVTYGFSSSDPVYGNLPDMTQELDVTDADVAGFVVVPQALADIGEDGGTTSVVLRLSVAAVTDVALAFTSSNEAVATLSPASVGATLRTLGDRATVTVVAVDDSVATGDRSYALQVSVASGPGGYAGLELAVTGSVTEDDEASLDLAPPSLADLAEGVSSTVAVMLGSEPTGTVTVAVSVSDSTELSVSSASLEFTPGDWNRAQEVELSGLADSQVDGSQAVTVTYGLSSSDPVYGGLAAVTQELEVTDVDVAGLVLSPTSLPDLAEGGERQVMVKLATQPTSVVNVAVSSSDASEVSAPVTPLAFTSGNWNTEQEVVLTGVADSLVDGTQSARVTYGFSSSDSVYGNLPDVTQLLDVTDVDVAGFVVVPQALADIGEDGGTTSVVLRLSVAAGTDVALAFTSSNEAVATLSPASVGATLRTLGDRATVTVVAVDDSVATGDRSYALQVSVASGPGGYAGLELAVTGSVTEDDEASLDLAPPSLADLAEGVSSTVAVMLGSEPTGTVTVAVSVSDSTELSVSSASLEFTPGDWNRAQEVELSGLADSQVDGSQAVTVTYGLSSSDPVYGGLAAVTQELEVTDVDVASLVLSPTSLPDLAEGGERQVMVKLATQPTSVVNVAVSSSDASEVSTPVLPLAFTSGNWNTEQEVVLTGVADSLVDGTQSARVTYGFSSSDPVYGNLPDVTQLLDVTDADVAGFVVVPQALADIGEDGGTTSVVLRLSVAAGTDVALAFTSSNEAVATLSPASVGATLRTLGDRATVTVVAVDDSVATGDRSYALQVSVASGPGGYAGLELAVTGSVTEDDEASLDLAPPSLADLAEGVSSTVAVMLGSEPTGTVTVAVSVSDSTELSVSSASLEFTPGDWNRAQEVELSAAWLETRRRK